MYPGVPLVSCAFYFIRYLATPRSVMRAYPLVSIIIFSGLMSRCMMFLRCRWLSPSMMHRTTNSQYHQFYLLVIHWSNSYGWYNGVGLLFPRSPEEGSNSICPEKHNACSPRSPNATQPVVLEWLARSLLTILTSCLRLWPCLLFLVHRLACSFCRWPPTPDQNPPFLQACWSRTVRYGLNEQVVH